MFQSTGTLSSSLLSLLLISILAIPAPARADQLGDSVQACAVQQPEVDLDVRPDNGISLGSIIQHTGTTAMGFLASVEPTLSIDWGSEDQITNLTRVPGDEKKLVFGDSAKGYQVVDIENRGLGVGIQGGMEFPNTTLLGAPVWVMVGLMPIKGRNAMAVRYLKTMEAVESRDDIPKIDEVVSSFDRLTDHDALSYNTYGGIVFWGGFGISFIGAQVATLARGDFQVYVEKVDRDHAYVKITDSNIESLALQAGALVTSISTAKYSTYAKSFGFMLNLHDAIGVKAFRDLVRGNIAPIQKLAASGNDSVAFFDEARQNRLGNAVNAKIFGIPFLFKISWSRDRYFETLRRRLYDCNRTLDAVYGGYFTSRIHKIFGVNEQRTKAFVGTSYGLKNEKAKTLARGFFGQLMLTYAGNNTSVRSLRKAMERMGEDTGLGNALLLDMPEKSDKMNNSSLTLRAHFSARNAQNIVNRATNLLHASFRNLGAKMVDAAFTANTDNLCSAPGIAPEGTILDKVACLDAVSKSTEKAVDGMMKAGRSLSSALRGGDEKLATKAFAAFGEAMMTNPFTFKTGLMMAGDGLKVDYVVEGSDIARYVNTMKTVGDSGTLAKEKREPLFKRTTGVGPVKDAIWLAAPVL